VARVILVTGGGRSGKSLYAQRLGESLPGPRAFLATCPILDDEMRDRVRRHQEARQGRQWDTIEETLAVADVLRRAENYQTVVVDCLTLWINNLMYESGDDVRQPTEEDVAAQCRDLLAACRQRPGTVIFVTNEVGMGIIPENPVARHYRDLAGRCNQVIAGGADDVVLVVCGIPVFVKR
jgi:adenosylcobinamide kinase/adenosylcobinamide-phosphate guanylyltransferase